MLIKSECIPLSLSFFFFLSFILRCYRLCWYSTVFIVFVMIVVVVIVFIMIVFIIIVLVIVFEWSSLSPPLPTHITVPNHGLVPLLPLLTCITAPAHLHYCSSLWMSGNPILSFRWLLDSYYPDYRLLLIDAVTIYSVYGYWPFLFFFLIFICRSVPRSVHNQQVENWKTSV